MRVRIYMERGVELTRTYWETYLEKTCYHIYEGFEIGYSGNAGSDMREITEFSDLIIPEWSAEEVLQAYGEICKSHNENGCSGCPFAGFGIAGCPACVGERIDDVIQICAEWKADHGKKEPEFETEWYQQGIIYKVLGDGRISQLMDGDGIYDTGCECKESAEEYMADKLKEFCKTHEGEYIATVERVCRIKRKE